MHDFVIRTDIPTIRPTIANIYGAVIENLKPGESVLIKRVDRRNILVFIIKKYRDTRQYSTLQYEGDMYLQRLK
jgi:hypothetical protein